jgi:hypothetical protein
MNIMGFKRQNQGKYRNFLKSNRVGLESNRAHRAVKIKQTPLRRHAEALAFRG